MAKAELQPDIDHSFERMVSARRSGRIQVAAERS
jgi:hypothetical protein